MKKMIENGYKIYKKSKLWYDIDISDIGKNHKYSTVFAVGSPHISTKSTRWGPLGSSNITVKGSKKLLKNQGLALCLGFAFITVLPWKIKNLTTLQTSN